MSTRIDSGKPERRKFIEILKENKNMFYKKKGCFVIPLDFREDTKNEIKNWICENIEYKNCSYDL